MTEPIATGLAPPSTTPEEEDASTRTVAVSALPQWLTSRPARLIALIALYLFVDVVCPRPAAVTPDGWRITALFLASIAGLMIQPLPGAALVLIFRTIPNSATITVPLEAFGDRRLANQNSLNWRASKRFAVGGQRKLEITADLFNAFNANTVLAMTVASGPSFAAITAIMPPRIIRIGATFNFW